MIDSAKLKEALSNHLDSLGVDLLGIAPLETETDQWFKVHQDKLKLWVEEGKHADMDWLSDKLEERLMPKILLPSAKNAIVLWMNHYFPLPEQPDYPTAKIARYAWGRDYHQILRKIVEKTKKYLQSLVPDAEFYASVDSGPVLERAFAQRGHIGWIGKSTMLIHPHRGTYGSLAVIFSNLELEGSVGNHKNHCGTCERCIEICPTQALSKEGLDARKCISYWTIEHRGMIPIEIRKAMGNLVFGCDLCQEICPWNRKAKMGNPEIWQIKPTHIYPNFKDWLRMSDEALNEMLFGSPIRRAYPFGIKRNILIVIANLQMKTCIDEVKLCLEHVNPVVRATAIWTLVTLGETWILGDEKMLGDMSQEVQAELKQLNTPN
jgi:epoxyqueuosine reductase